MRFPNYAKYGLPLLVGLIASQYRRNIPHTVIDPKYTDEHSKFLELDGWRVHYRLQGNPEGKLLVLLHGTASSLHTFDGMTERLQADYLILRYDLPGFGLTGGGGTGAYSWSFDAAFLSRLLEKLELRQGVNLVGNSLGGKIAWEYALRFPESVSSLVLIDSGGFPWPKKPMGIKLPRMPLVGEAFRYITPRAVVRQSLLEVYGDPSKVTKELVQRHDDLLLRAGNRVEAVARIRMDLDDSSERISQLECPTLILWGEKDRWIPLADAYRFQEAIQGSHLVTYPELGHVPHEENPTMVAADITGFLKD